MMDVARIQECLIYKFG